jgi:O-antigen/teichoic acid export membrane protein
MPVMNATPLKEARSDKWATEYGLGTGGFETWQVILGAVVFLITALILWIPLSFIGVGIAGFVGFGAAVAAKSHRYPP